MEQRGRKINVTVIPTEQFEKDVKYYIKKKGFTHIGADIKAITDELEKRKPDRNGNSGIKDSDRWAYFQSQVSKYRYQGRAVQRVSDYLLRSQG